MEFSVEYTVSNLPSSQKFMLQVHININMYDYPSLNKPGFCRENKRNAIIEIEREAQDTENQPKGQMGQDINNIYQQNGFKFP